MSHDTKRMIPKMHHLPVMKANESLPVSHRKKIVTLIKVTDVPYRYHLSTVVGVISESKLI